MGRNFVNAALDRHYWNFGSWFHFSRLQAEAGAEKPKGWWKQASSIYEFTQKDIDGNEVSLDKYRWGQWKVQVRQGSIPISVGIQWTYFNDTSSDPSCRVNQFYNPNWLHCRLSHKNIYLRTQSHFEKEFQRHFVGLNQEDHISDVSLYICVTFLQGKGLPDCQRGLQMRVHRQELYPTAGSSRRARRTWSKHPGLSMQPVWKTGRIMWRLKWSLITALFCKQLGNYKEVGSGVLYLFRALVWLRRKTPVTPCVFKLP